MRRLLLILVLILIVPSAIQAQSTGLTTTTTDRVNIRSGPGTDWRIITTVNAGTSITLDGQALGGSWVRGITSGGTIGWLAASLVSASPDQIGGLRSIWVDEPFTLSAPAQSGGGGGGVSGGQTATATARVSIRTGPDTSYRRVDVLPIGAAFTIDGRDGSGNWVRGITQSGRVGWVFSSYISLSTSAIAALPVVDVNSAFSLAAPAGGSAPETPPDSSAPPSSPPSAPIVNTAPVRGFSYGGHVQGFGEEAANWMRAAGMTWVKKQWRYVDGQSPDDTRGMINDAHARGFRIVVGVIGLTPGDLNNQGYYGRYASFVAGMAANGADAIEIWNEPNIDREWPGGQINPAQYTELLRQAYAAIKAANPNTLVISGAPSPTGFYGGCSGAGCDDNFYVEGMARAGAANYMDCIGIHYNEGIVPPSSTSGDPRGNSGHYTRYLRTMMDVYYNAFGGARPLCFTELGYLSGEGYPPLPGGFSWAQDVTVQQQAAWVDGAVDIARRSGRVRLVIIWNVDFQNYGGDPQAGYAIIRPGGGCPACEQLGR